MKKRRCECGHIIDRHSHMNWHECKEDGCGCPAFAGTTSLNSHHEEKP